MDSENCYKLKLNGREFRKAFEDYSERIMIMTIKEFKLYLENVPYSFSLDIFGNLTFESGRETQISQKIKKSLNIKLVFPVRAVVREIINQYMFKEKIVGAVDFDEATNQTIIKGRGKIKNDENEVISIMFSLLKEESNNV